LIITAPSLVLHNSQPTCYVLAFSSALADIWQLFFTIASHLDDT